MNMDEKKKKMIQQTLKEMDFDRRFNEFIKDPFDFDSNMKRMLIIKCLETGQKAEDFDLTYTDFNISKAEYDKELKSAPYFIRDEINERVDSIIKEVLPDLDVDLYIEGSDEQMEEAKEEFGFPG